MGPNYTAEFVLILGVVMGSYLLGSIPTGLLVTRWRTGADLRKKGSGHIGGTNTMRAAGWAAGALVGGVDLGKGFLATWMTARLGAPWYAIALAGGFVVVGHCWPLLAGFRGGMGIATGAGALLAVWPPAAALGVTLELLWHVLLRHTARANLFTGLSLGPSLWLLGGPLSATAVALTVGSVVAYRSRVDWNRQYSELWLDRGGGDEPE